MSGRRPGHRVVVVGSGWAGLAAAVAARASHADVTLVDGGPGASALGPGALDDVPWEDRERATALGAPQVAPAEGPEGGAGVDLRWIASALGTDAYDVPDGGEPLPLLCTLGGRLRAARGRDTGLLDLGTLPPGARVLVPRADRAGWDADALAQLWSADARALTRRMTFQAVDADVLRFDDEPRIADADLAARHDEAPRLGWLGERLREAIPRGGEGAAAIVVGPWLGVTAARAAGLSRVVGLPVGEALAPLSATAGLRFEAARAKLLAAEGVRLLHGRVRAVETKEGSPRVVLAMGDPLPADAVVLAIGGLVGGGIVYAPSEHGAGPEGADRMRAPLHASVVCGARVEIRGEVGPGSSTFGPALDDVAWPVGAVPGALERAGLREADLAAISYLHGAGEVIANLPRTVGVAVSTGRRAGNAAAGDLAAVGALARG